MSTALIIHSIEDSKHCLANNLHKNNLLFSTNSSVDTFLRYEHKIECKCLSSFLLEEQVISEIKKSCDDVDKLTEELDNQFSPMINQFYDFKNILFFKTLYSFILKYHLLEYRTILLAVDTVIKKYDLTGLFIYDVKGKGHLEISTEIKDLICLLEKEIPVEVVNSDYRPKKALLRKYRRVFRQPSKVVKKLLEYTENLKFIRFKSGRRTVLMYESLYDLEFLRKRFSKYNIIYYKAWSHFPFLFEKHSGQIEPLKLDLQSEKGSLMGLIKNEIKEDFERQIQGYVSAMRVLDTLHKKYNIALGITGNAVPFGIKAIIFEYLRSKNIPTIIAAHGCNYGLQDVFGFHRSSDYSRCDYFLSYGFTREDFDTLYGDLSGSFQCKKLPYGSVKLKKPLHLKRKREVIDILFPIAMTMTMFEHALIRVKPEVLTEIQIKLINHLDTKNGHVLCVKPFVTYNYNTCAVVSKLKRLKNVKVIDDLSFQEVLQKYDVKAVVTEFISSSLGESLPYDLEMFVLGYNMDYFDPAALELLKKRVYYTRDVEELMGLIDSFLEKKLQPKRDDTFLKRYLLKDNTEENILRLIDHLTEKSNRKCVA